MIAPTEADEGARRAAGGIAGDIHARVARADDQDALARETLRGSVLDRVAHFALELIQARIRRQVGVPGDAVRADHALIHRGFAAARGHPPTIDGVFAERFGLCYRCVEAYAGAQVEGIG